MLNKKAEDFLNMIQDLGVVIERSSYLVRYVLLLVIKNGFLFPDAVLSSFPSEAEETLLIDIASNSEYLSKWS